MLRNLFISFENKTFSKKVNYLFRQYDFSLKNMTSCNKVNYLLRKCLNSISKISVPGQDPPRPRRWGTQLPESPGRHRVQYIDKYKNTKNTKNTKITKITKNTKYELWKIYILQNKKFEFLKCFKCLQMFPKIESVLALLVYFV